MKRDIEIAISCERSVESVTLIGYIQVPCGKLGALLVKTAGSREYELDAE